ncbi:hypothetical protein U1Q18_016887, partial [Sarracenia purpurea var. burkii]
LRCRLLNRKSKIQIQPVRSVDYLLSTTVPSSNQRIFPGSTSVKYWRSGDLFSKHPYLELFNRNRMMHR